MSLLSKLLDRLSDTELKPLRDEEYPTAEEVESCNVLADESDPGDAQQLDYENCAVKHEDDGEPPY